MPMSCCGNATTGALTQLAAMGAMESFLCIAPEHTFFRQLYRRYTNFAMAEACVTFCSSIGFDRTLVAVIPRNGDLISWTYFEVRLSALSLIASEQPPVNPATDYVMWGNAVGQAMIKEVTFQIGGAQFDKLTNDILFIWEQVSAHPGNEQGEAIGQFDNVEDQRDFAADDQTLWVFLPHWYARHYSLALPLIALQYHDVRVQICTARREDLIVAFDANGAIIPLSSVAGGEMLDADLLVSYIYLDTQERRVMAQQPHEFLISQWQINCGECVVAGTTQKCVQLYFNHAIQEIFAKFQYSSFRQGPNAQTFNYGIDRCQGRFPWQVANSPIPQQDPFDSIELKLNGHDRVARREAKYFRQIVPYQHHTQKPKQFIYNVPCFALDPEDDDKPSGACDFSRIDNVVMGFMFATNPATGASCLLQDGCIDIFARNHNVLKIAGGMGALRFAN